MIVIVRRSNLCSFHSQSDCNWWKSVVVHVCPHMCACFFAQMWKTLFVRRLVTPKGRLYKIPACWSNGTVGKATIVVVTMKRLSSMTLREKCTQFVFCPSLLLSHSQVRAHTFFPSALVYPFNPLRCSPAHTFFSLSLSPPSGCKCLLRCRPQVANAHRRRRLHHLRLFSSPARRFCDNADTVCNIMAHGGVKSHCAHIWSNVPGVKASNSSLEQSGKAENGLDYSVTLLKRPKNAQNWLQ